MRRNWALLLLCVSCGPPIPAVYGNGWHPCLGRPTGCAEWYVCHRDHCDWVGDTNDPGPAGTQQEGSFPGYVPH